MDIFGIGLFELLLIFSLALVILGPDEILTFGGKVGVFINHLTKSEQWRSAININRQIMNMPHRLAREANIEEIEKDLAETVESLPKYPEVPVSTNPRRAHNESGLDHVSISKSPFSKRCR